MKTLLTLLLLLLGIACYAHGDLHERILKLSQQIKNTPASDSLYMERGKLYYHHQELDSALADLQKANSLGYKGTDHNFWLAKVYLADDQTKNAEQAIAKHLKLYPFDINALRVGGTIALASSDLNLAYQRFFLVVEKAEKLIPENILELSTTAEKLDSLPAAESALVNGIEQLGNLVVLEASLINIYLKQRKMEQVVAIYEKRLDKLQRKERYYYELANIYDMFGEQAKASEYLSLADQALEKLPPHLRQTAAMHQLAEQINSAREKN